MSGGDRPLRDRIHDHYDYLVGELRVSNYLDALYRTRVISDEDKEQLRHECNRREQARNFLDALMRKPEDSIASFFEIVKQKADEQPQIYDKIFLKDTYTEQENRTPKQSEFTSTAASPQTYTASPGASPAEETDPEWAELLRTGMLGLDVVAALRPSLMLDRLRAAGLITLAEQRQLQQEGLTDNDRSQVLLKDILPCKGKGSFQKFCCVLLSVEGQQHIVKEILKVDSVTTPSLNEEMQVATVRSPSASSQVSSEAAQSSDAGHLQAVAAESKDIEPLDEAEMTIGATFYFRKEDEDIVKTWEESIRSMCLECFGIPQNKILFVYGPTPGGRGFRFYGDSEYKLAVLHLLGVHRSLVLGHRKRFIRLVADFLNVKTDVIRFKNKDVSEGSSIAVFLIRFDACLKLLCAMGSRARRIELGLTLREIFPELDKAMLRLGGLPPIQLFDALHSNVAATSKNTSKSFQHVHVYTHIHDTHVHDAYMLYYDMHSYF